MAADIENFIRDQKAKLASERRTLTEPSRPRTQEKGLPLTNRDATKKRSKLGDQRREEYNQYLKEREEPRSERQRRPETPPYAASLPVGESSQSKSKAQDEEKQRKPQASVEQEEPGDGGRRGGGGDDRRRGGGGGEEGNPYQKFDYKEASKHLAQERRQEYNDMLASKPQGRDPRGAKAQPAGGDEIANPSIIPFNRAEEDRQKKRLMEEERQRDYQKMKAKLDETNKRGRRPAGDEEHVGLDVGQYEKTRSKDRQQEEYRRGLQDQQEEKRRLQLQQQGIPVGAQNGRDVPRLDAAGSPTPDQSQPRQDKGRQGRDTMNKDDEYKQLWGRYHPDPQMRTKKRGQWKKQKKLDIEAVAARGVKAHNEREYDEMWEQVHNRPSPRTHGKAPAPAGAAYHQHHGKAGAPPGAAYHQHHCAVQEERSQKVRHKPPPVPRLDLQKVVAKAERRWEEEEREEEREAEQGYQDHGYQDQYQEVWRETHHPHGGRHKHEGVGRAEKKPRRAREDPQSDVNAYEEQKKRLTAERKEEMQSFMRQQKGVQREQSERRQWREEERATKALPDTDQRAEATRRKMAEDRQKEYQELRQKSAGKKGRGGRREWDAPETAFTEQPLGLGQNLGQSEAKQQQLQKERQEEYNARMKSLPQGNRSWREPSAEKLLPVGQNEGKKKTMEAERNREYNEFLKSKGGGNRSWETAAGESLPLGGNDGKRRAAEEERKREYQEYLKKAGRGRANQARPAKEELYLTLPIGEYDESRKKAMGTARREDWLRHMAKGDSTRSVRFQEPAYKESGLPLGRYAEQRKMFDAEKKQDYNDYTKQLDSSRTAYFEPGFNETGLRVGDYDEKRKMFDVEKKKDYNDYMKQMESARTVYFEPGYKETGLRVGDYAEKRKIFDLEKKHDYNDYLKQVDSARMGYYEKPFRETPLPLGGYEETRRSLDWERQRDYNDYQKEVETARSQWQYEPAFVETPLPLGRYEEQRQWLDLDRKQEYNRYLTEQQTARPQCDECQFVETSLPLGGYETQRYHLNVQRNKEYNDLLAQQGTARPQWFEPAFHERSLPLGGYEHRRNQLNWERRKDTQDFLASQRDSGGWVQEPAFREGLMFPSMGQYESKQRRLAQERQKDTQEWLWKDKYRTVEEDTKLRKALGDGPLLAAVRNLEQPQNNSYQSQDTVRGHEKRVSILDQPLFPQGFSNQGPQGFANQGPGPRNQPSPDRRAPQQQQQQLGGIQQNLQEKRQREYNEAVEQQQWQQQHRQQQQQETSRATRNEIPTRDGGAGLFSGPASREGERNRLREERQREYNEMVARKKLAEIERPRYTPSAAGSSSTVSRLASRESEAGRFREDRNREYQNQRGENTRAGGPPSRGNDLFSRLGSREGDQRARLQQERSQEYNDHLKQQTGGRRILAHQTDEYKANNFPGMNSSDNAKLKARERNDEYNKFLQEKNVGRRVRYADQDGEFMGTLPGMGDANSAKVQKELQRNREYNQFLASKKMPAPQDVRPPPEPRRGWATPTYEDILDKKRHQEAQYRRTNDAAYDYPLESERKLAELDKELEKKKTQFRNERLSQGVLEDPAWLSSRRGGGYQDAQYSDLKSRIEENIPTPRKEKQPQQNNTVALRPLPSLYDPSPSPRVNASYTTNTPRARLTTRASFRGDPSTYYASLPIGQGSDNAKQRAKDQYRDDLQQQMREAADGRRRAKHGNSEAENGIGAGEKTQDLKVAYSGYKDPEDKDRAYVMAQPRPRQPVVDAYQDRLLAPGLEKLDTISPRSELILGRRRLNDYGGGVTTVGGILANGRGLDGLGVLDQGFEGLLQAPRISSLAAPAGLEYQPSSYVTGAGTIGKSSVDDAYNFYATHNPLEDIPVPANVSRPPPNAFSGGRAPNVVTQEVPGGYPGGGGGGGGRSTRVHFKQEGPRPAGGFGDFPTDDDKRTEAQKKAQLYQEELQRQIAEKKYKKMQDKEERERYDMKLEREAQDYNPYGKGGGGAPMRDAQGNLVTNLRQVRRDIDNPDSPRKTAPYRSPRAPAGSEVRDDLFGPPPVQTTAEGEQSYARGGHGIFGMPKTEGEKNQADKYKDDLRRQIEERKLEEQRRKDEEKREEEREQRRVDEQQLRMQTEFESEQKKIKEKEEEARKKNEELVRLADERKKEAELRRRAAEDTRMTEQRQEQDAAYNARMAEERGKSPAIPTLRNKEEKEKADARGTSPPVPAARTRAVDSDDRDQPLPSQEETVPVPRAGSADVLNQLAAMRKQLQSERQRVEHMLQSEKNEPDVFDPRLVQRPPPAPIVRPEIDVFETALNGGTAVQVRRTPADRPNPYAADEFASLKHKGNTDSRKEFLKLFPEQPSSSDNLEAQQAALLRQQESSLRHLRDNRDYDTGFPSGALPRSPSTRTPQQLHSDSAFVDVESVNYFPDDFDDLAANSTNSHRRNESARARRRTRREPSPSPVAPSRKSFGDPFGSTTSLNVDRLSKKNEDRLKRLRELQGDDMSLYDPDDVLDRFMSKQNHHRPPSGQTLQDDTWMYAGSKASGY